MNTRLERGRVEQLSQVMGLNDICIFCDIQCKSLLTHISKVGLEINQEKFVEENMREYWTII